MASGRHRTAASARRWRRPRIPNRPPPCTWPSFVSFPTVCWWLVWCFHDEAVETQKKINIYILTKQLFWAIQVHKVRFLRGGVPGGVRRVKGPGRSRWRRRRRWILGGGTRCKKRRPGQPTNIHSPALASKQPDTDTTRFGVSQSKQRHIFDFCKQLIFMFIILIIVSFRSVDYVTVVRWSTNRGGKFWFPIFLQ